MVELRQALALLAGAAFPILSLVAIRCSTQQFPAMPDAPARLMKAFYMRSPRWSYDASDAVILQRETRLARVASRQKARRQNPSTGR